jgi:alanine racemase
MNDLSHPAWIEIDLAQFRLNVAAIRRRIGSSLLCFPIKANAYGHGLVPMGQAAAAAGVDRIAVSCLSEGVALRKANVSCPVLVLGAIHEDQIDDLIDYELEFTISSRFKAELVAKKCKNRQCQIHLEVDTGMHRTGMRPETAYDLFQDIKQQPCFLIRGIYSHLATADEPNHSFVFQQIEAFERLRQRIGSEGILWHLANSGGVYFYPDSYFDMVRPGLLCYGLVPDGREDPEIRPFFSVRARLSYFKVVGPGCGISYGHLYTTERQTRIVTVPVGYGDGYCRSLTNRTSVLIRGRRYPAAGRICMDQFMVDIGDEEAYVGDVATLIGCDGKERISLWDLSRLTQSDPREILCRFNERIPRIYRD